MNKRSNSMPSGGDHWLDLMAEAGVSRGQRRLYALITLVLWLSALAAVVLTVVGVIVGGGLVWRGVTLLAGVIVLLTVVSWIRRFVIRSVRWTVGTVTLRTVTPGAVGEDGQYVVCRVRTNPPSEITQVAATIGPFDANRIVAGAVIPCMIDRAGAFTVLRAYPYAAPGARLPSGRMVKFRRS